MAQTTRTLQFAHGTTNTITTWTVNGSTGVLMTVKSDTSSPAITRFVNQASSDYINLIWMQAEPKVAYAGTHSTDGGNNTNWVFTAPVDLPSGGSQSGPGGIQVMKSLQNLRSLI